MDVAALNASIRKLQKVLDGMIPVMSNYETVFQGANKATEQLMKTNSSFAKSMKPAIKSIDNLSYAQSKLVDSVKDGKYFTEAGVRVNEYGQALAGVAGEKMGNFNKRTQILTNTVNKFAREGRAVPFLEGLTVYLKQGGTSLEYFAEFLSSAREELTVFGFEAAKARKFMYGFLPRGMFRIMNQFSSTMQFAGGVIRKTRDNHSGLNKELEKYKKLAADPKLVASTDPQDIEDLEKIKEIIAELEKESSPNIFKNVFKQMKKVTEFSKNPIQFNFETDKFFEGMKEVEKEATKFGKIKNFFRITPTVEDKRVMTGLKDMFKQITTRSFFKPQAIVKALVKPKQFKKEIKKALQMPTLLNVDERKEASELEKKIKIINKTLKGVQYNTPEMKDIIDNDFIKKQESLIEKAQFQLDSLKLGGVENGDEVDKYNEQIKKSSEFLTQYYLVNQRVAESEEKIAIIVNENRLRREKLQELEEIELRNGRLTNKQRMRRQKIEQRLANGLVRETNARSSLADANEEYRKSIESVLSTTKEDLDKLNKKGKENYTKQLKKSAEEYYSAFASVLPIINKTSSFGLNTSKEVSEATKEVSKFEKQLKIAHKSGDASLIADAENELADAKQRVLDVTNKSMNKIKNYTGILNSQKELLAEAKEKMDKFSLVPDDLEEGKKAFEVQAENIQKVVTAHEGYQEKLEILDKLQEKINSAKGKTGAGYGEQLAKLQQQFNAVNEEAENLKEIANQFGDAEEIIRLNENMQKYEKEISNVTEKKKELLKSNNAVAFQLEIDSINEVIKKRKEEVKSLKEKIALNEEQIKTIEELYSMGSITETERDERINPLLNQNEQAKEQIKGKESEIATKEGEKSNAKDLLKEFKQMRMESLKNLLGKHKFFRTLFKVVDFFKMMKPVLGMLIRGLAMSFVYLNLAIVAIFLIIKKAWPVVSSALEKAFGIVKTFLPFIGWMMASFSLIKEGVIDVLSAFFGDGGLESLIDGLVKIAVGLLGVAVSFGLTVLSLAIVFIGTLTMELWTKVKDWFIGTVTDIKQFAKSIAVILGIVGVIVALIAGAPIWLAAVIGLVMFKVGKWLVRKMKKMFGFDFFADGGTSQGGMAVVGEEGPELVNLPKGATVFSNKDSKAMVGGKTQNVVNNFNITVNAKDTSQSEMRRIADMIGRDISAKINRSTSSSTLR